MSMFTTDTFVLAKAYEIAHLAHFDILQTRDDGSPFIHHPLAVAREVAAAIAPLPEGVLAPYGKARLVAAAVLHDVPEDCPEKWTKEIAALDELVLRAAVQLKNPSKDHKDLPRPEQKKMDRDHYADPAKVDEPVVIVKYKDRIHNVRDTKEWNPRRRGNYMDESVLLHDVLSARLGKSPHELLRKLNADLSAELLQALSEIRATLTKESNG